VEPENPQWRLYDDQASTFEGRAGLPAKYCSDIAESIVQIAGLSDGDLIVEIGPGTGQIGASFGESVRYLGLDLSRDMLEQFRRRLDGYSEHRILVRGDANHHWPVTAGTAKAIFSSRALHLLPVEHVAAESLRIARHDGATLIVGRVERDRNSVRSQMARQMIEMLRHRGLEGRRGERHTRNLIELWGRRGGQVLPSMCVARWTVAATPRESIESWRCLQGLAGIPVPADTKEQILSEIGSWAKEIFGGLDEAADSEESYVLWPIRVNGL
jgi:hypothetical protein